MIKASKKSMRKFGSDLATALHAQKSIDARMGLLNARSTILGNLERNSQYEFQMGFNTTMDVLEPLPSGTPRSAYML